MTDSEKITLLRDALIGLIGSSEKEDLEKLEILIRVMPGVGDDKIAAINAIHALLKTS